MKKIFFAAALVFTTSVLTTMVNTANLAKPAAAEKMIGMISGDRYLLATAD